tara:strand:+ start:301 stop:504 length:204 start_codon:yes stop_codon:yes gene_type:complete
MRTYYCDCGSSVEVIPEKLPKCKCGKVFGVSGRISDYINMRNTWSGQTKVEFNRTTMDKDIAERNAR